MNKNLRDSGIDIIGDLPWGTHFCQFYQTKEDLMDILVPYFKAGLENNEFCMWVTSKPLGVEEAKNALRGAVPDIDIYLEKRQIEIISYTDWYIKEGIFDSDRVLNGWVEKLNQALSRGYAGLRLTGNTFWLEKKDWNDFVDYEEKVDRVLCKCNIIALCTYCLDKCNATEIIDVVVNHQFALIKREGKWEQIESSRCKEAEEAAIRATKNWEYTFDTVPDLITIIDEEYRVVRANRAMAARLGVAPEECIGLTCYRVIHGTNEPSSFCPHRQLLADGIEHTTEVHEERLGGYFIVSVSPLHDSKGKIIGCIHVARDITERKKTEEKLQHAYSRLRAIFNRKIEGIGIIIANADGDVLEANDYYLRILGFSREELEAGIVRWLEATPPEWLPANMKAIAELKEHGACTIYEKEYLRRDGSRVPVLIAGTMFPGDRGEILAFVLDITKRKQEEHRRYRYSRILEGINKIFSNVMQAKTEEELANTCLSVALELTSSQIGFVGLVGDDGLLHDIAMSEGRWDKCLLRGLYGNAINNGKSFFTNNPPLISFLGVPLIQNGKTIGVLVVANREGGYSYEQQQDLEATAPAVTQALQRKKVEQERARAEEALRESYENLQVQSEELQAQSEELQMQTEELQAQSEELHEAYELLSESEIRFRTLAENSPDVIARFDRENRHTYANPAAEEPYGHSPKKIIGKTHTELGMDSEKVKFWESHHEKVFVTGKPETMEFKYTSPQGKEYYFNTRIVPEFVNGKVNSVLAISRDITLIKEAEAKLKETLDNLEELVKERTAELERTYESLKESERGLAEAQKMAHLGNWEWNITTNGLYWSDEIFRIFGRTPQEFGTTYDAFLGYVHPDDRDYVNNAVIEALNGKPYSIDHRIILANGEERIVHEQGEVTFNENNNPVRMKGTVQDITERKRMEAALESVARLPQENPNPVIRLSQGLIINYANPAAQKLLTDWSSAIGQEAPAEITELAIAALEDGIRRELECNYADHTYLMNLAPFPLAGYVNLYARDITERKVTEEELQKSEEKYRNIVETTNEGILIIDGELRITYVNRQMTEMLGYSQEEMIGRPWCDFFDEEGKAIARLNMKKRRQGIDEIHEFRLIRKDGSPFWVLVSSKSLWDKDGKFAGSLSTLTDITERKKAEDKIQTLANAVESSDDAIITESLDGIIISWNTGAEQIYCYSAEEVLGKNVSILEPENLKGEIKQLIEKTKQEEKIRHYETLRLRKDGTKINVSVTLSPVFDISGKFIAASCISRDITESIKAKEALRLSNIYNRSLIEASLDPLVTIGHDGKITDVNTSTELVTGYSRDELIGTDFTDYFTEPEKAKKGYQEVFREGFVSDYALEIRHRNGRTTPILFNASVYKDEAGEVIGVFAAARDITERKKAEEILRLKLEELARSNAELEQFAYVSSHDLQEPLRMITSYLQLLQRRYQGKLDEKADKYIYFAVDGASRMQVLINDLLEFSRVTTRAKEPEPTDCESLLDQVLSNLELYIKENKAIVSHDPLPEVIADNTQLVQVFQNLIVNGIKFHSENAPEIHISAEKKAGEWMFSVRDNGIGISPQYSEKIFEVFKRLHKKEEYPGTGIGLAICKKIVERHSGHIWVESGPGKGSTFYFTLPIKVGIND